MFWRWRFSKVNAREVLYDWITKIPEKHGHLSPRFLRPQMQRSCFSQRYSMFKLNYTTPQSNVATETTPLASWVWGIAGQNSMFFRNFRDSNHKDSRECTLLNLHLQNNRTIARFLKRFLPELGYWRPSKGFIPCDLDSRTSFSRKRSSCPRHGHGNKFRVGRSTNLPKSPLTIGCHLSEPNQIFILVCPAAGSSNYHRTTSIVFSLFPSLQAISGTNYDRNR